MIISRHIQTLFQRSKTVIEILHLHCLLLKTSLDHHEYFFSQLILYATSISLHDARKIFDYSPISPPPLFAWNTMIKEYSNNSSTPIECIKLFVKLLRTVGGLKPDKFTYPFVIKACGRCSMLGVGGSVHSMVLKSGFGLDPHVNNTLLRVYGVCGVIDFAQRVFDEMADRDVVSWSSIIAGYVDCERPLGALMVFREMNMVNEKPNLVTLVSLIAACTNLLNIRHGKSIHSYLLVNGIELHVSLGTALLNLYAKCGLIEEAFCIFSSMSEKNLQSWTAMISGLTDHGNGEEAISLFTRMEETGLRPDGKSFSTILCACSHNVLVEKGQELFEKMVNDYNIKPTMEHYGCIVDLYGRAGKIEEAYQIIMGMPMEPNSVILRSYLSSCKQHGCILYGNEHLKQLLLKIEPDLGANYVLAASVSSPSGYCDDVDKLRISMEEKGLVKVPGYSWVQLPSGCSEGSGEQVVR
ncbi:pentatricopeptide repeat-containing protein At4g21065-like [Olea europaea var. sylvestris]|uniref:pentatricopeptide repeat-containing protein At4g21065-like n=1 Tax=Olea europaea var. sylvestris TaxID=158386 RepID=UPI000C1CEC17|nr:pentatricopeptide repeat-containing protein At4g21065-like [Olea europaea var. sylvestris]